MCLRMKWCELREYKWNEYVTIAVNRNLSNCKIARKKVFRGFNGIQTRGLCISAAVLYQLSYEDPYTRSRPIYWVHQPVKGMKQNKIMWAAGIQMKYVTIAVNRNLSNCKIARKNVCRGFNGIRTRGLCVGAAVLYQLSYENPYTGSRPIYWVLGRERYYESYVSRTDKHTTHLHIWVERDTLRVKCFVRTSTQHIYAPG